MNIQKTSQTVGAPPEKAQLTCEFGQSYLEDLIAGKCDEVCLKTTSGEERNWLNEFAIVNSLRVISGEFVIAPENSGRLFDSVALHFYRKGFSAKSTANIKWPTFGKDWR